MGLATSEDGSTLGVFSPKKVIFLQKPMPQFVVSHILGWLKIKFFNLINGNKIEGLMTSNFSCLTWST